MRQILAIFKKDARRFLPEILVSLAILVAFVVIYPVTWRGTEPVYFSGPSRFFGGGRALDFFAGSLLVLVPISWWILIARLIHGERLVGDNQFWLTRPYEWPRFLGAKLLFLAVFLYTPFFLAQFILLAEGGFHPLAYLPGLLYNLLMVSGILVLPLAAFSTVTTGFGRLTLVILGLFLFIGAVALGYSQLPADTTAGVSGPLGDKLSFLFLTCGCGAVVVLQYALRKVRLAWIAVGVVAALICALAFLDPDQFLMDRYYPAQAAGAAPIVQLSFAPKERLQPVAYEAGGKGMLNITIPIQASGISNGTVVTPVALKATIDAADAGHWVSSWQAVYNEHFLAGVTYSPTQLLLRRAVYDRFRSAPVTLYLTIAFDEAKVASTQSIPLPTTDFYVPDFGVCSPKRTWLTRPLDITNLTCRSAVRQPQLTFVTAQWTDADCAAMPSDPETILGAAWSGSFSTAPAEFGITSVWQTSLFFSNSVPSYTAGRVIRPHKLCPESPVTFTKYERVGSTQVVVTIPNFQLPKIAHGQVFISQQ